MLRFCLAFLCLGLTAEGSAAQSLSDLARKSEFIQANIADLKKNNAVTAYTTTLPYCPAFFWWSTGHDANETAKRSFIKSLNRKMKLVGFNSAEVKHCTDNSGFVFRNNRLEKHRKNSRYIGPVDPAVMMIRDKVRGTTTVVPVTFEIATLDDNIWAVYDRNFKKICGLTGGPAGSLPMKCKGMGTLKGSYTIQASNRTKVAVQNENYQMLIMTNRPPAYVKRAFSKEFR